MSAKRLIVAQSHSDRFMAAVHRNEIDIHINEQIAFSRTPIQHQWFFVFCLAKFYHAISPLSIMVVVTIGIVSIEYSRSHHAFHFPLGHLAMQTVSYHYVHIVYAVTGEHV